MEISLENIKDNLIKGLPILLYDFDDRESEVDMVFYGGSVSWKSIYTLRREAGGLICYVTGLEEGKSLGLTLLTEEWSNDSRYLKLVKKPVYGDLPAFSIWVNHITTRTGISDEDRARTVRALHDIVVMMKSDVERSREKFWDEFMAPGHVPILLSRGIRNRRGHTELVTALADVLGLPRSMVIAEMLDKRRSLSLEDAVKYAKVNDFPIIRGKELLEVIKIVA
ncbi:3,4-dihydroxy-2-butanone-4-phosphate synthase [Sulfolobales archaeon HS-7]|nr:3,4-dihydroxy-2-butanone-4-phosphate synthase [Sulfolobales archaeon HS-7]